MTTLAYPGNKLDLSLAYQRGVKWGPHRRRIRLYHIWKLSLEPSLWRRDKGRHLRKDERDLSEFRALQLVGHHLVFAHDFDLSGEAAVWRSLLGVLGSGASP